MAFGAEIKLSVSKAGKASFRKEIQDYINEATLNTPVLIKNLALDISSQKQQQMVSQLQQALSAADLTIKVNNIDASVAVKNLRDQLTAILGGLQVGGLRTFLGTDGVADAYEKAGSSAQKLADAAETVRQKIVATNAAIKELGLIQNTLSGIYKSTMNVGDTDKLTQYVEKYRELESAIQNAKTLEGEAQKQAVANISATTSALSQEVKAQLESEKVAAKKAATTVTAEQAEKRRAAEADRNARSENNLARQAIQLRQQINQYVEQNSTAYKQYSTEIDSLLSKLQSESELSAVELSKISREFARIKTNAQESGLAGQTFFEKLKDGWSKFGGWAIVTKSMMSAQTQVRKMIDVVRELDAAMTELRKVTDLSETEYEAFFEKAIKNAKKAGATLSDTIVASADFARLGYDVEDAASLAQAALIYKNVGDGIENVSDASESLISTIKAFGFEADNAMHVVDAFNEVGNNFAISSVGIGDALQRSASALAAANNTMEESIGLAVGMNNVLQNPQQVGTILKTSSMYLRAAKVDLEEAGESTEGMAISVSVLREKILALTKEKVDIQIDENTFKSTFQVYKELSEVWQDIKDIDQAAIIELIGGKRNASGIISLLTNFADAEAAASAALDSFGSATTENEKYLDSIAGKVALLELAFETLSSSLIGSDVVKGVVDIATAIINLITWLQRLNLLLPLIAASITLIKGKKMLDDITKISQTVAPLINQLVQQKQVTDTLAASVSALSVKEKAQLAVQIQKAATTNAAAGATSALTQEQAKAILSSLGLATANTTATVSTLTLKGAISGLWAVLKANPLGVLITVASIVIPLISGIAEASSRVAEEAIQKANEIKTAYSDAISSSKNSLKSLEGMKAQFSDLSNGVDSNGKNVSLTNDQYNTYLSLVDSIIDISPGLVKAYDSSGNAILNYSTLLDDAIKYQKEYAETQRKIYLSSGKDLFAGNTEEYKKSLEKIKETMTEYRKIIAGDNEFFFWEAANKRSKFREVSENLFGYDASAIVSGDMYSDQYAKVIEDLQNNTRDFIQALKDTGAYTNNELVEIEDQINESYIITNEIADLVRENAGFLSEYFRDESWYGEIPLNALDEYKAGLEGVIDVSKGYRDNLSLGAKYGEEFAQAISSADVAQIMELSNGLENGSVSVAEFNAAIAAYGESFDGTLNVGNALLDFLYSLSVAPAAPSDAGVIDFTKSYEKLADTISVAEKALDLLNSASKEMKEDGTISADTLTSIIELLAEEEKLTDYVSAQGDVLIFNAEAWHKRAVEQYESKLATIEAENAILESSEATEENTRKIAENNAMIGIYKALIAGAAEATKEATGTIGDAYDSVSGAIDNVSKMGRNVELTYDAYLSMIEADKRYANSVQYVNGMLTINRDKYNEVTDAIIAETLAMAYAEAQAILLSDEYKQLSANIGNLDSSQQQRLDDLNAEVMGYSVLASELNNASSAYQRFLNYTDTSSTNRYNTALKAYDIITQTLNDKTSDLYGKFGNEQFKLAVDYVLGENVEVNTPEFKRGLKLVERYLMDEGENATNFYNDLIKNGIVNATTGAFDTTIVEISEKLGISQEIARALMEEMQEFSTTPFDWVKLEAGSTKTTQEELGGVGDSADTAQTKAQALVDSITSINNEVTTLNGTPIDIQTKSTVTSLGKVSSALADIITKLTKIANTGPINVQVNTVNTTSTGTSSSSNPGSVLGRLFGSSASSGTQRAAGGETLVGELGMETVVDPHTNRWYTVGENGAQFVTLPENAIVFNAQQTESLFRAGRISSRGEAMASGNAAVSIYDKLAKYTTIIAAGVSGALSSVSGTMTKPKAKSPSGGGSGSSSSSTKEIKDPLEELKDYYSDLIDQIEHLIEHQIFLYKQAERGLNFDGMALSLQAQAAKYQEIMAKAREGMSALQAQGAKDTDSSVQEMERIYWDAYDSLNSILDQINALYVDALTQKIDDIQNAYSNLSKAADEFAEYGGISVDTFQALIANGVQYLSLLKNMEGQYVINKEGIQNIIAAQKEQLAIESALSYISQIKEALNNRDVNALQNLVSLTNQISDAGWDQVYAQVALLQTLGLTDVQYAKILENIDALRSISSAVVTDIVDGANGVAEAYNDQEKALDKLLDYTQDLIKYETNQKVKAIEKQIKAYQSLIDLKKKSLQTTKDEASYEDAILEKVQKIAKLQASIDQLSLDDSRAAIAERLALMEELAALQKELSEAQSSHAYDSQIDALDKMAEEYEESRQADIDALENSISSAEKLYQAAIERISTGWSTLYDELIEWNTEAGSVINDEITEHWNLALEAAMRYGSYLEALQAIKNSSSNSSTSTGNGSSDSNIIVADELPRYHSGGIVGEDNPGNDKEIVAILERGEIVLDDVKRDGLYRIIDFQKELSERLGSDIASLYGVLNPSVVEADIPSVINHDVGDNTSIMFNPVIRVEINNTGETSDSDARKYGKKIADTALDNLKEAFSRRGIGSLGNAKLARG